MNQIANTETESWLVGYAFTINSIIGSGILVVP